MDAHSQVTHPHCPNRRRDDPTTSLDTLVKCLGPRWGYKYIGHTKMFMFGNAVVSSFPIRAAQGTRLQVAGLSCVCCCSGGSSGSRPLMAVLNGRGRNQIHDEHTCGADLSH